MEKFKIVDTVSVSNHQTYLLNKPFHIRIKDDDFRGGRISSYHQRETNEPEWLIYPRLLPGAVKIAVSMEPFTSEEALNFMASHNGIGLTRDNLFMLPSLFPELFEKRKPDTEIVAFMHKSLLPTHLNGETICPMIRTTEYEKQPDYDWRFYEWNQSVTHPEDMQFAYFVPLLQKSYWY